MKKNLTRLPWAILSLALLCTAARAQTTTPGPWDLASEFQENACTYRIRWANDMPETQYLVVLDNSGISTDVTYAKSAMQVRRYGQPESEIWLIYPEPSNPAKYRFQTMTNGEFLSITEPLGFARRWAKDENSQLFQFVNIGGNAALNSSPKLNIRENTRNEMLSRTPNWEVRRWAASGNDDQLFTLERADCKAPPKLPVIEKTPDNIPSFRVDAPLRSTSLDGIPMKLRAYTVAASRISALVVNDPNYTDKRNQMKDTPFYTLVEKQYWDRSKDRGHATTLLAKGNTEMLTYSVQKGFSASNLKTITDTFAWEVSGGAELKASSALGDPKVGPSSSKEAKANLTFKYGQTHTEVSQTGSTTSEMVTTTTGNSLMSTGKPYTVIFWGLVSRFELFDGFGRLVNVTEYVQSSPAQKDSFPADN